MNDDSGVEYSERSDRRISMQGQVQKRFKLRKFKRTVEH